MSAVTRYHTLVTNIGKIYSSNSADLLQSGLREIAEASVGQWDLIKKDSERLLTVWCALEDDSYSRVVVDQIMDILNEFASASTVNIVLTRPPQPISPSPTLVVSEKIAHVSSINMKSESESEDEVEEEEDEEEKKVVVCSVEKEDEPDEDEDATVDVVEPEEDEEPEEEEEEEAEDDEEPEEEKVVEPDAEEEEVEDEEAMEVEQVTIRGRAYWLDSNTNKLYANAADDEVGDEVGAMVNGKPVFLAK